MIKTNFRSLRWDLPGKAASVLMALLFSVTSPAGAIEIIKDNSDSSGITTNGTWITRSSIAGYHGSNYLHDNGAGKGTSHVTFTPTLPQAGSYLVYAKWTESWQRPGNVPYIIQHGGGTSTVLVDQTSNGGKWHLLGTYTFAAGTGGYVRVSNAGTLHPVVADAVRFVSVDSAPNPVVMDNTSAGVTFTGTWSTSTAETGYFHGSNYLHDGTPKTLKTARFTPTIAASSHHHVYIKSPGTKDYSKETPVTIHHNRGSTMVKIDQRINTGRWVYLGCYGFSAGTTGYVEISNAGTSGYVIVDAVKFLPTKEIIQDAGNTTGITLTGTWTSGTSRAGFYGGDYISDGGGTGKPAKSARFTPTISQAGHYEVFTRWPAGDQLATNVPVEVTHSGGTAQLTVNQSQNQGVWQSLGVYYFSSGTSGNVLISNTGTSGYVIVDAVRFVPQLIVDNAHTAGVEITGTWTAATSPAGHIGANHLHDGNDFKGSRFVRFSPTVVEAGRYDVFVRWTADPNRATNARYYIASAAGTALLSVDQRTHGGEWVFLGNYPFHSGTSGNVLVSNAGSNGFVVADAVRFAPREYSDNRVSVATPEYTSTVSGDTWIQVVAPGFTQATAKCWQGGGTWGSDSPVASINLDSGGNGSFLFPAASYPHGPITVRITGTKGSVSDTCYLQLYNSSGTPWKQGIPAGVPPAAAGAGVTQLVFADDFNAMPSISTYGMGATYGAHKQGGGDFSEIPFGDPGTATSPFSQIGSYLRIRADENINTTGLINSIRPDGTGVLAAAPAYFECRFIASSASGTWPTFWLLTYNGSAFTGVPTDELDIIEAYGGEEPNDANTPRKFSVTSHNWNQTGIPSTHKIAKSVDMTAFAGGSGWMDTPHTYGCLITATDTIYYLDDVEVGRHQTSPVSQTQPFFFMANLAVGGLSGWPVDLSRYNGLSDMYIDYIRVFKKP